MPNHQWDARILFTMYAVWYMMKHSERVFIWHLIGCPGWCRRFQARSRHAPRASYAFSCLDIMVKHSRAFLIYNMTDIKICFWELELRHHTRKYVFTYTWTNTHIKIYIPGPSEQPRPWPRHFLAYQYFYLQKIHWSVLFFYVNFNLVVKLN